MSRAITRSVALLILVASGLLGLGTALGQIADTGSPAQGHASVIAQGVAVMAEGDLGWRVRRASAAQPSAESSQDDPGFLLADQGALLVNHIDTERQTHLAPGEATFLPVGSQREEAPLGGGATYYRIDLVGAGEVADAGSEELLFIGEPFASPGGNRDVDLVRDVLAPGEAFTLAAESQAAPVLLLVTAGTTELVPAANEAAVPVALPVGQGAALGGDVIVTAAGGAGATIVTAFVGPEVPDINAQVAAVITTPQGEPASVIVQILACPVAYAGTDYATDCVDPVADVTFDLSAAAGVLAQGTTGDDGAVTFVDLLPDTYSLTGGVPGEFANQFVACADETGAVGAETGQTQTPGATITVEGGDAVSCRWYVIPEDLRGDGEVVEVPVQVETDTVPDPDPDTDGDGLLDSQEAEIGADPTIADTDADGLLDSEEGEIGTDPANPDTDADGLLDGPEIEAGYDPTLTDSDGDGFGDSEEPVAGAVATAPPAGPEGAFGIDSDSDGLSDGQENALGTNPATPDSDGDGLTDFDEIGFPSGPATGTDPLLVDSDGDGVGDGDEIANGSDPRDPTSF